MVILVDNENNFFFFKIKRSNIEIKLCGILWASLCVIVCLLNRELYSYGSLLLLRLNGEWYEYLQTFRSLVLHLPAFPISLSQCTVCSCANWLICADRVGDYELEKIWKDLSFFFSTLNFTTWTPNLKGASCSSMQTVKDESYYAIIMAFLKAIASLESPLQNRSLAILNPLIVKSL